MAYSRCVCVLGLPRSGTSTVAGMLHRLGVNMGEGHFQEADANNPRGYYEDVRWQAIAKSLTGERYGVRKPAVLPEQTQRLYSALIGGCAVNPLWGFKGPRTVFVLRHLLPLFAQHNVDMRFIVIVRDTAAVVASLRKHSERSYRGVYRMNEERARKTVDVWMDALREAVALTDKERTCCVLYEEILKDPRLAARRLAGFVYAGLDSDATEAQIANAAAFVDRGLNHNGDSDCNSNSGT